MTPAELKRHLRQGGHKPKEKKDYSHMAITLDHNYAMAEFVGPENGLTAEALAELTPGWRAWTSSCEAGGIRRVGLFRPAP